ncbi:MAG: CPBP family intramembrane metalloprotease [Anaerolineales bacterium]|nr:CPBP family intramembrane metalloprotease [Anaerolineales bacterium]
MSESLAALFIVAAMSTALVISGIKKVPGIGVLLSFAGMIAAFMLKHTNLAGIGFVPQENWLATIGLSLLLGAGTAFLGTILIDPLAEKITGVPHDLSLVDGVRGNLKSLLSLLLLVWVTVAFLEEIIFRGFMMTEIAKFLGTGGLAMVINILVTAVVFGLAHWYQGKSGVLSTAMIGILISIIFVLSGLNLWLVILIHGFIDTAALILMYRDWDKPLKMLLWKS